jgi:putative ABC transport system ATP-binding protein
MQNLIESTGLNKSFSLGKNHSVSVLKNIDLKVRPGEYVSVMGPSGSGKSTLLYSLSGMEPKSSGRVVFDNMVLDDLPEKAMSRLRLTGMGFVFQHIHLLKNLNLRDNILLPGYLAKLKSRKSVNSRAAELMELTGIASLAGNDITQASGGQLQRVGICRALINDPDVVFGDEPTGALDSESTREVLDLLGRINATGTTVFLVTHDVKVAARSERVLLMKDGRIVSESALGRYAGNDGESSDREQRLASWLREWGC